MVVNFTLNGHQHALPGLDLNYFCSVKYFLSDDGSDLSLATYIRERALLTGTKVSCNEGGCGACIVTVNKEGKSRSVNSVLTSS